MNLTVGFLGFADAAGAWLLTYLLHSTALLVPALLLGRWLGSHRLSLQESVVRVALVGGLLTASLQVGMGWEAATGSIPYPSARSTIAARTAAEPAVSSSVSSSERQGDVRVAERRANGAVARSATVEAAAAPNQRAAWLAFAIVLWAATGAFLLARLGVLVVRLSRTLRGRSELSEGSVFRLFWRLLAVADVDKPTRLTRSGQLDVPIALGVGRREICLPDRVVEELPQEQQETVLAHELAHLERRDPAWLLLARALESVLFVQPLNRVARCKLQQIAEYRCDDWAAEYTGRPLTLAKCLTAVATWSADRRLAALAPTMAGKRSGLGQRVRRLLDPAYSGLDPRVPGWWRPIAAAGLVAVIVAVPGFSTVDQEVAPEAPEVPAGATEVTPEAAPPAPAPPVPEPPAQEPVAAPGTVPSHAAAPSAVLAPMAPTEITPSVLAEPALAAVAPTAPEPVDDVTPVAAPAPPEPVTPALEPAPQVTPAVAPEADVKVAVSTEVAPKIASRVIIKSAPIKVSARIAERVVTRVEVRESDATQEQDEADEQDWDEDGDDWEDEWDDELEDDLDELEDELDEMMDEIEDTLEEEIEIIADELEEQLDALEEELEETIEAELEMFEEELENDLELFEEELEELEESVEERLETAGSESREETFENDIEVIEDSFDRLDDRLDDHVDRIEDQIERQLERILEPLMDHQIEAQIEAIEDRIDAEADRMEEMAERLSDQARERGDRRLSAEEREQLLAEARRVAEEIRPTPEEIATMRSELDRLSQAARPSQEELDRLREELRQQLDALRVEAREGLVKQREDLAELRRKHRVL